MGAVPIVVFDAECALCDAAVRFITANATDASFRYEPLGSPAAATALERFESGPADVQSIILIDADGLHRNSTAALRIVRGLRRPWRWLAMFEALPLAIRDPVYAWIANNRYRWFGRISCVRPKSNGPPS